MSNAGPDVKLMMAYAIYESLITTNMRVYNLDTAAIRETYKWLTES